MADWIKILLSTVAGLLTGLLAEPLKASIQSWLIRREIRITLDIELAHGIMLIWNAIKSAEKHDLVKDERQWKNAKFRFLKVIPLAGYELYAKTQPSRLYSLTEYPALLGIYQVLALIKDDEKPDRTIWNCKQIVRNIHKHTSGSLRKYVRVKHFLEGSEILQFVTAERLCSDTLEAAIKRSESM